jgi:RNA polymerase sigma-70 factor, ECF subfamily
LRRHGAKAIRFIQHPPRGFRRVPAWLEQFESRRATFSFFLSLIDTTLEELVNTVTDSVLLDQLRGGNANGLSQLYGRYHERVLRYCAGLMNDREHAEDIVQNVFLKLHAAQHTIRNGHTLQCWLFTVARNEAYTELSKRKTTQLDESLVWDGDAPDDELIRNERKEIIDSVLQRLHLPYREVIMLRVYEQLSYEEIAAITCTTVSSVKSRLFKARKVLVQKLHPYFYQRGDRENV